MPFNGNVGMHDASWRSSFGADIYLRNGSHGCVNLPSKKAEVIYGYVEQGEPVIVYGGQMSVPRTEPSEQQPQPETTPNENVNPELTPEQQIQILIEAGILNPDGTPVQPSEGILPEVPTENPIQTPQEIPTENLESLPQQILMKIQQ